MGSLSQSATYAAVAAHRLDRISDGNPQAEQRRTGGVVGVPGTADSVNGQTAVRLVWTSRRSQFSRTEARRTSCFSEARDNLTMRVGGDFMFSSFL